VIIKGKSRGRGAALGVYLQNQERNERATVLEVSGTIAQDATGALKEMEAYAEGTKCTLPLYHAQINPEPPYQLTREQMIEAVDLLEKELGLTGQPRVIVAHEKDGREHFHVVWARIDLEKGKAISDSHNFPAHEKVARELERRFGHPRVQGAHAERENEDRPERSPTRAELRQEQRTGIKGKDVRQDVTELFHLSAGPEEFRGMLDDHGYVLATGDKRGFVIVDRAGGIHSLARRIEGMKAAELRAFMAPLDRENLPNVEQAKLIVEDRKHGGSDYDQQCWDDALATSAIDADERTQQNRAAIAHEAREQRKDQQAEARPIIEWEDKLAAAAIEKAREIDEEEKRRKLEARADAKIEAAYAKGDDYATQTLAARRDNERRNEMLTEKPKPQHPDAHQPPGVEGDFAKAAEQLADKADVPPSRDADDDRLQRMNRLLADAMGRDDASRDGPLSEEQLAALKDKPIGETVPAKPDYAEMDDQRTERMQRLLNSERSEDRSNEQEDDPDRQPEVPGEGRARNR
jgi:hypothetical protein